MASVKEMVNGGPLPNWVKLLVIGGLAGSVWAGQQAAVGKLQEGQRDMTTAIQELRTDIKTRLVTQAEMENLKEQVMSNTRRLDMIQREQR